MARPFKEDKMKQTKMILTPEQTEWIRVECKKRGASAAQVVRDLLNVALDTLKAKAGK